MGHINETDVFADAYKFRTPSLRKLQHTAPYGHNGAYKSLQAVIQHHATPLASLNNWDRSQLILPKLKEHDSYDFLIAADKQERKRLENSITTDRIALSKADINALVAFMEALTDEESIYGRWGIPESVPSHLSIKP